MSNTTTRAPRVYTIPAGTKASRCKGAAMGGSCSQLVYWIDDNGDRRIVDADVEGGKRPSETRDKGQLDLLSGSAAEVFDGRGVDHHATCVDRDLFRRRER